MGVVDHEFVKAEMLWHSFCFLPFFLSFSFLFLLIDGINKPDFLSDRGRSYVLIFMSTVLGAMTTIRIRKVHLGQNMNDACFFVSFGLVRIRGLWPST